MKANVAIDINDEDRDILANLIDGKVTKRMATRKDIVQLCEQHIGALVNQARSSDIVKTLEPKKTLGGTSNDLLRIDPEDQAILAGKPDSYVIGWNRVKRGQ